jgi:hypothetical protein
MIDVNKPYDADLFKSMFDTALRIVYHREDRPWHNALRRKYLHIHPAVLDAMKHVRPTNWQQLLLEYPHRAESDPYRIAYTRDERAGEQDRQTVTTIGKYLMRHFDLPDHRIRDIVALYTSPSTFKILDDVESFVHAVNNGPGSCMCWREDRGVRCSDRIDRHPYHVYDPKYGWRMAVRIDGGRIDGRALLQDGEYGKYFVRSFKRGEQYSYSDEQLEAWLKEQGFDHRRGYEEGTQLAYIPTSDEFLAPYIDGSEQRVSIGRMVGGGVGSPQEQYLYIDPDGEYECDNTDGTPSGNRGELCESCDEHFDPDDMTWVGRGEDTHVCDNCCNEYYTWAYTRRGNQAYIYHNDVIYVDSQDAYYDEDYLDDNNIVALANGDYEHTDNAVYVENAGDWYHCEDERIVCTHDGEYQLHDDCVCLDNGEYALIDEAFYCEGSSEWYLKDDYDPVVVDGKTYHPEYAPETNEESTETGE